MKKKYLFTTLIISLIGILVVASCKKKEDPQPTYPDPVSWSPDPVNGQLPTSVLPAVLVDTISQFFTIYSGETPAPVYGEFLSEPHKLLFSTSPKDSIGTEFYPRYICFERNNDRVNFFGKQWDDSLYYENGVWCAGYYEESYYRLNVVGTGDNFTCYYITEAYPNGMYAKQATIFSGQWNDTLGGLGNFQVAVILLETSGNPNLEPAKTFRVLGDEDGLAENHPWVNGEKATLNIRKNSAEDAFRMFRK